MLGSSIKTQEISIEKSKESIENKKSPVYAQKTKQ